MEEMTKARILLVEDDEDLLLITSRQIKNCGYEVVGVQTGAEALQILNTEQIDLAFLDVMLPDYDGHELCKKIRSDEIGYGGPIIFMSCLGDSDNIVAAFREGGNDYIVKPARESVIKERIEENLKNFRKAENEGKKHWFHHFMLDQNRHEVYKVEAGILKEEVILSPKEYSLLEKLVEHEGEILLYRQLYRDVWGQEDLDDVRTLMVHISNLRKKLGLENADAIRAVRGAGYLFQDVSDDGKGKK